MGHDVDRGLDPGLYRGSHLVAAGWSLFLQSTAGRCIDFAGVGCGLDRSAGCLVVELFAVARSKSDVEWFRGFHRRRDSCQSMAVLAESL